MKISVITTVLNEAESVSDLLDSLLSQTKPADEIVVIDGGSSDSTYQILQEYVKQHKNIKVYKKHGNIAQGRNEAVRLAENEIIAQIDGGCIADKHWLARITEPFKNNEVGLVAGFYEMIAKSDMQKAVAPFHGVTPRKFDPRHFLPSGRSMAFRKSTWDKVGGYSEDLQWAGEDTLFNYKVVKSGIEIARVPSAYVYWEVPKTLKETINKFYKYALGDAQTGIWWHPGKNLMTHNIKILSIYFRYILLFIISFVSIFSSFFFYILILYIVIYSFWSIWKLIEDIDTTRARLLVPIIQVLSDFAVMSGFFIGLTKKTHTIH